MKKNLRVRRLISNVMRITITQLFLAVIFVGVSFAYDGYSQEILNRKITLQANDQSFKVVLEQIEKMAEIRFIYSPNLIKSERKVNINVSNSTLNDALKNLLAPLNIEYRVSGKQIVLKRIDNKLGLNDEENTTAAVALAQNISGKITDAKGEPLIGASATIKGTTKGAVANATGNFIIENVANGSYTLVFSFVGYANKEVKITVPGSENLSITLEEDADALDEVVVTGVFDKRTRMESSVAISTLNSKQIDKMSLLSAADLLKNIPGVYVNSSLGEIRNTVYSRGVSVGSNDGSSGYYYVSMQEDGLPVTNATYGNYGPDYFLRPDATLGKLEAVRGGTASILGNNAPGGIFNYVSKTGGRTFEGEVRAKYGLEGNGINPFYRVDANFGGPLSKDGSVTYNVGGFWRQSDGARYPGYPMNNGGQMKANIVKNYKSGSLKFYVKYLDDHNAWFEFLPTVGFSNPQLPAGVDQTNSVLIPPVTADFTVNNTGVKKHYDSRDKIHSTDKAIGLNWEQTFGEGWTINNNMRYSDKSATWNTTAVAYPFAADGLVFYAIPGLLGQFGTYNYTDKATGANLGSITQAPNIINGQFAGFNFIPSNTNFPGSAIQKNSLLFNPVFFMENNMKEFIDQFTITKRLKNMSFTAGMFYANSSLDRLTSQDVGIAYSTMSSPRPHLTSITLTGFDGKTYQVTNPDGVIGGSGKSAAMNTYATTQNDFAFFFGHNWSINDKLNFDWGLRAERIGIKGTNGIGSATPSTTGGTDGNPLTLYDNTTGAISSTYAYDKTVSTFSYSGGLNYKFNDNTAIYARYSQGQKAPDMDIYLNVNTDATQKLLDPIPQKIQQIELGLKLKANKATFFITPYYSLLNNVANQQVGQETADLSSIYATPVLYNSFETKGIELEGIYNFTKQFSIRGVATFQKSIAVDFRSWLLNGNGKADDQILSFSGNEAGNVPSTMIRFTPTYSGNKLFASLEFTYMGSRQANVPNAFLLPSYTQNNLNLGYSVSKNLTLQVNINNILNENGIMSWSAPGGFPAALNRDGFTKAQVEANPNAVYSTVSIPPRSFFLTVSYKF